MIDDGLQIFSFNLSFRDKNSKISGILKCVAFHLLTLFLVTVHLYRRIKKIIFFIWLINEQNFVGKKIWILTLSECYKVQSPGNTEITNYFYLLLIIHKCILSYQNRGMFKVLPRLIWNRLYFKDWMVPLYYMWIN